MQYDGSYVDAWGQKPYSGPGTASASGYDPTYSSPDSGGDGGGGGGGGGDGTDWKSLLLNSPGYLAALAAANEAKGYAGARRKQNIDQAFIQYGGDLPAGFTDKFGDISKAVMDSAKGNQFSTLANLLRSYTTNESQFKRGLAARGALQSGDLNYGENQLNTQYGQQKYDAANAFGSSYNQSLDAYEQVLEQNQQNLANALFQAEQGLGANPGYQRTPTTEPPPAPDSTGAPAPALPTAPPPTTSPVTTASFNPSSSAVYGQPLYTDGTGTHYDANGNPFKPGGGAKAAPAVPGAPAPAASLYRGVQ